MEKLFLLVAVIGFSSYSFALDMDWKLYLRASAGANSSGGKQITLKNPKTSGNEFRLGNETAYGEAYFNGHLLKGGEKDPFFDANLTFAYSPQMNSQYGDVTSSTDGGQVIQAFVKGGRFDDMPFSAWAGKRFYRDVDLNMDDFFYFADMSGVGGGIEDLSLGNGTLAIALLQHSDNTVQRTTNGVPSKQAVDVRWRDLKLSSNDTLFLWFAAGYSAPGTGYKLNKITNTYSDLVDYEAGHGMSEGVRWRHALGEKSFNNLSVQYGTGVMDTLTLDNWMAYAPAGTNVNARSRLRIVENPVLELTDRLSLTAGLIYEDSYNGLTGPNRVQWLSGGVRPIYYFTEHYRLAFEAGYSQITDDSETDTGGGPAGSRTLTRFTLAPEIAIAKGYFARPVLRAYVTHSSWNAANADRNNSSSLVSVLNQQNINMLDGTRREETQFGVQAEVWF